MGSENSGCEPINQFALVSYIPDPLGHFLDRLRLQLVPECRPHAHVTVLPPRPIQASAEQAESELRESAARFNSFEVRLGSIELFKASEVVYIEVASGGRELRRMHQQLNAGAVEFNEPFEFHPHITLAQNLPKEQVADTLARARGIWADWKGSIAFSVDELAFVQNTAENIWLDRIRIPLVHEAAPVAR